MAAESLAIRVDQWLLQQSQGILDTEAHTSASTYTARLSVNKPVEYPKARAPGALSSARRLRAEEMRKIGERSEPDFLVACSRTWRRTVSHMAADILASGSSREIGAGLSPASRKRISRN